MNDAVKVELPGNWLYPDDCFVQTFSLADASALSLLPKTQDVRKVFDIMDRKINLDVKKLTLQDFWFLLYWQRINSYITFPIKLPWECPHCNTKNQDELSASKLVITDLDPEYEVDSYGVHGVLLDLPSAGETEIRLKLVGDELEANTYIRKLGKQKIDPELYEQLLVACMLEPNGGTLESRLKQVQGFTAEDYYVIKGVEEQLDYGVKPYSEFTCMECKEVSKVSFDFDLATFFPDLPNKSDIRARILPRKRARTADNGSGPDGSSKDIVREQDSHQLPENSQTNERPENERSESQEKTIEMTPQELQALIQREVSKVGQDTSEYKTFDEVDKG